MARPGRPRPPEGRLSPLARPLFQRLADGEFHSGAALARELGVTRSAVWKSLRELRTLGADIHAVPKRGYRLAHAPGAALEPARLLAALPAGARERLDALEVAWSIPSTNAALLERAPPPAGRGVVLLAEHQTAGRGRRGRPWLAPLGGAVCLSVAWTFAQQPPELAALGLALGVSVRRALGALGVSAVELKWPNDLVVADRKLGGILTELRAEAGGPAHVVIGVGLNLALRAADRVELAAAGVAATDLAALGCRVPRNSLVAALITDLLASLAIFSAEGFASFAREWSAADALRGRSVQVESPAGIRCGVARGIDATGALRVETPQGVERYLAAEVSVRAERDSPRGAP